MSWFQRFTNALTRGIQSPSDPAERAAVQKKQAELEERIRCLECKVHGLDGRTTEIERRHRDDPFYDGPERRHTNRASH